MKYEKPELNIEKFLLPDIASSVDGWLNEAGTKDTAITSFFVLSI